MPRAQKTARISTGGQLPPSAPYVPQEDDIIMVSDDEEEMEPMEEEPMEDMVLVHDITGRDGEEWYLTPDASPEYTSAPAPAPAPAPVPASAPAPTPTPLPTPTPAPASAPPVVPVYPVVSTRTPTPSPTPEPEDDEAGWHRRTLFPKASGNAYYHKLLKEMLGKYYPDLKAKFRYMSVEHYHPVEATCWETFLTITSWNEGLGSEQHESTHTHGARRQTLHSSLEDAAEVAYLHYHGRRFEAMRHDKYRYLPRNRPEEDTWAVLMTPGVNPAMDAAVDHLCEVQVHKDNLTIELGNAQAAARRHQVEIDHLRAQLGMPPLYKENEEPYTYIDTAP